MFLIFFIFFPYLLFSQSISIIESQIDSLKKKKNGLENELELVINEISRLEQKKLSKIKEEKFDKGVPVYTKVPTHLYENRGTWYKTLAIIPKSTAILAYDFKNNYYFVEYDTLNGFVFTMDVETLEQKSERLEIEKKQNLQRSNELNRLVQKYGKINGKKIYEGKIWLGMTKEMVIESWGEPDEINRSVGSWGIHEQLVYGNQYLYIRDNKLSSWQD